MTIKVPHQMVQNMKETRRILQIMGVHAVEQMTPEEAQAGESEVFKLIDAACVNLGVLLDKHIEGSQVLSAPEEVKWTEKVYIPTKPKTPGKE